MSQISCGLLLFVRMLAWVRKGWFARTDVTSVAFIHPKREARSIVLRSLDRDRIARR